MLNLYKNLFKLYGPQGWWPINKIYHKKDYSYPKNNKQILEICIGAILTQNTSWKNVEKSLENLKNLKLINANKILKTDEEILKEAIKPSGYFNQKTKKIKIFSEFFIELNKRKKQPSREELLKLWGIGKETADSILLYAYNKPIFVVDTYTKRIFENMTNSKKMNIPFEKYDEIQDYVHQKLIKKFEIYQEFHALLVEHAKNYYLKKPYGKLDPLI